MEIEILLAFNVCMGHHTVDLSRKTQKIFKKALLTDISMYRETCQTTSRS